MKLCIDGCILSIDAKNQYEISRGDKVAQIVLLKSTLCDLTESRKDLKRKREESDQVVSLVSSDKRGSDGFGSTGK